MPTFGDIMEIEEAELPDFNILVAPPPCQDFSTMGMARGPYGRHSTSFPVTTNIMEWKQPIIAVMEEVIGFLTWNSIGEHLPTLRRTSADGEAVVIQQEGAAFTDFQTRCDEFVYYLWWCCFWWCLLWWWC
jgi:site-specific DNA-cytosine methylase